MDSAEIKVCRICFEDESTEKPVISPCKCRGSAKFIHEECLNVWISEQVRSRMNKRCEICKYEFKIEVLRKGKCDFRESISKNPCRFCYFMVIVMVFVALAGLLSMVIEKRYVDPDTNLAYFLGVVAVFGLSMLCAVIVAVRLMRGFCFAEVTEEYKVYPFKSEEMDFNTTHILSSLHRVESVGLVEGRYGSERERMDLR